MKNFIEEFKAFAIRGNVVELATAVVIGTAFGKIVSSLVENVMMPLIGVMLGGVNFTTWVLKLGDAEIKYGTFIQSIFDFTLIALAIFIAIKLMKKLQDGEEEKKAEKVKEVSEEVVLLREIRDSLRK